MEGGDRVIFVRFWRWKLSDRTYKRFVIFKLVVVVYTMVWGAFLYQYFSVIYPKPDLLATKVILGAILLFLGPDLDTIFMSYKKFNQEPKKEVTKKGNSGVIQY